jgi:hypothetical protein
MAAGETKLSLLNPYIGSLPDGALLYIVVDGVSYKATKADLLAGVIGGNLFSQLITIGETTIDGNDITIAAGTSAQIGANIYTTDDPQTFTIPFSSAGKLRTDIIVINTSGVLALVSGTEGDIAVQPAIPTNTVLVTKIEVAEDGIGAVPEPTYLTIDERAAITYANAPSEDNPFATMDDLPAPYTPQDLDSVTNEGAITSNTIVIQNAADSSVISTQAISVYFFNTEGDGDLEGISIFYNQIIRKFWNGSAYITNIYTLPNIADNATGILALTSDIPESQNLESVTTAGKTTTKGITLLVPTSGESLDSCLIVKLNSGGYTNGLILGHRQSSGDRTGFITLMNVENFEQITLDYEKLHFLSDTKDIKFLLDKTKANGNYTIATTSDIPAPITIDATPTDGSSNAVSSNGVFNALALRKRVYYENASPSTAVTGTVSETQISGSAFTISANTINANSHLFVFPTILKTVSTNTTLLRLKFNTTNNYATATTIATFSTTGANNFGGGYRKFIVNAGNIKGISFTTSTVTDILSSSVGISSASFPVTGDLFFFWSIQNNATGDSTTLESVQITS